MAAEPGEPGPATVDEGEFMDELLTAEPATDGPAERGRGGRSRLARRRRILLGVGAAAALLSIGGLVGAAFVKSPAQLAADAAPPPDTVTTAKVTDQVLTSSVV